MLVVWGKNDEIFVAAGAAPYQRDNPRAEIHLLDTGHFALETHGPEIARLMRDLGQRGESAQRERWREALDHRRRSLRRGDPACTDHRLVLNASDARGKQAIDAGSTFPPRMAIPRRSPAVAQQAAAQPCRERGRTARLCRRARPRAPPAPLAEVRILDEDDPLGGGAENRERNLAHPARAEGVGREAGHLDVHRHPRLERGVGDLVPVVSAPDDPDVAPGQGGGTPAAGTPPPTATSKVSNDAWSMNSSAIVPCPATTARDRRARCRAPRTRRRTVPPRPWRRECPR